MRVWYNMKTQHYLKLNSQHIYTRPGIVALYTCKDVSQSYCTWSLKGTAAYLIMYGAAAWCDKIKWWMKCLADVACVGMTRVYCSSRFSQKWNRKLLYYCIDMTLVNTFWFNLEKNYIKKKWLENMTSLKF